MKLAIARLRLWSQSGPRLLHNSLVYAIPEPQRGHHHCWEANDLARSFCVTIRLASLRREESHELNKTALRLSERNYKESAEIATHTNHRKLTRTKKLRRSKSHCFKTLVEQGTIALKPKWLPLSTWLHDVSSSFPHSGSPPLLHALPSPGD